MVTRHPAPALVLATEKGAGLSTPHTALPGMRRCPACPLQARAGLAERVFPGRAETPPSPHMGHSDHELIFGFMDFGAWGCGSAPFELALEGG